MNKDIDELMGQIERVQYNKLYKMAQKIIPNLTEDDLLQPNDYPRLENNPIFRYEEGVLEGVKTARMALLAYFKDLDYQEG